MTTLPLIQLDDQQSLYPELGEFLVSKGEELLQKLDRQNAVVSLVLCGDEEIRLINQEWRGKDTATDVLSFPQEEGHIVEGGDPTMPHLLGDIVISVETCARQAKEWEHTLEEEAIRLWIHGFLHLCGYVHETAEETLAMRERERECLSLLGTTRVAPLARLS